MACTIVIAGSEWMMFLQCTQMDQSLGRYPYCFNHRRRRIDSYRNDAAGAVARLRRSRLSIRMCVLAVGQIDRNLMFEFGHPNAGDERNPATRRFACARP